MNLVFRYFLGAIIALGVFCRPASADEGMWLFNDLPRDYLKKKYGFDATDDWANHVMLSSVRFNSGGSASFVSSNGLVITNHHVGADTLHKVSTKERNVYKDGFLARSQGEEIKAPDLELNQLVSIEDVTARVNAAVQPNLPPAEAFAARRAVMAEIEQESTAKTGLRSDVITLYGGARYHLYRYKKYTDVRLVWAPEADIAFFGGDPDNFEFPRYDLDVCIFRVYEDDKPAQIEHYLQVAPDGVKDGELVFVSGNPGRTQRIFTYAALKFLRDVRVPYMLDFLRRKEVMLQQYSNEGVEQARRAKDDLFSVQNSRKAYTGMLGGLQDPAFLAGRLKEETAIREKVEADHALSKYADAWRRIEEAQKVQAELQPQRLPFGTMLFEIALDLVQMADEDQKPNADRLPEYRETGRESLLQQLFSDAPIYDDLEQVKLADDLSIFIQRRGGDDPLVQQVLGGKSPEARAAELVGGTKLGDVAERRRLAEGGQAAIAASTDPMIQFARLVDAEGRRVRKEFEENVVEVERQAYSQIAEVMFGVRGTDTYPDATFTLRLAFGEVKGYEEGGKEIAPFTTMGGAFEHEENHGGVSPWKLPETWHRYKGDIDPKTPFNFVCTADIIGGNSGSPVVNEKAELVGVIFDGNIQSLTSDYQYSDVQGRAVSVDVSSVLESLRKIYGATELADELGK